MWETQFPVPRVSPEQEVWETKFPALMPQTKLIPGIASIASAVHCHDESS